MILMKMTWINDLFSFLDVRTNVFSATLEYHYKVKKMFFFS